MVSISRSRSLVAHTSKCGWGYRLGTAHNSFVSLWLISFTDYILMDFVS